MRRTWHRYAQAERERNFFFMRELSASQGELPSRNKHMHLFIVFQRPIYVGLRQIMEFIYGGGGGVGGRLTPTLPSSCGIFAWRYHPISLNPNLLNLSADPNHIHCLSMICHSRRLVDPPRPLQWSVPSFLNSSMPLVRVSLFRSKPLFSRSVN